jgi:hypothetical protein
MAHRFLRPIKFAKMDVGTQLALLLIRENHQTAVMTHRLESGHLACVEPVVQPAETITRAGLSCAEGGKLA